MITVASDFGEIYHATMRGVLYQRTDARIADISSEFPRHDVRTAGFWLRTILPYYPPSTHLVVIDPGVGTDRSALVVRSAKHLLVGPDNGVLIPTARRLAKSSTFESFRIDHRSFPMDQETFHGRDLFAPVAADVHDTAAIEDLPYLTPTEFVVDLTFPEATIVRGAANAEVLVADRFGTLITNVPGTAIDRSIGTTVTVNGEALPAVPSYGSVSIGDPLVTVGGHGFVEIAVNRGRADRRFDWNVGDRMTIDIKPNEK